MVLAWMEGNLSGWMLNAERFLQQTAAESDRLSEMGY